MIPALFRMVFNSRSIASIPHMLKLCLYDGPTGSGFLLGGTKLRQILWIFRMFQRNEISMNSFFKGNASFAVANDPTKTVAN
jgi:hypothetical protein